MRVVFVLLASLLILLLPAEAFAATTQDVTVTYTPAFVGISNAPGTWALNGITGDSKVRVNTIYYSNPLGDTTSPSATVVDGECRFTLTNSSTVNINLSVTCSDFSGGSDNSANSNTGSNGATSYGSYSWYSGLTYANKVVVKTSGSDELYHNFSGGSLKWGAEIKTQTNDWSGGSQSTATMTISAIEHT